MLFQNAASFWWRGRCADAITAIQGLVRWLFVGKMLRIVAIIDHRHDVQHLVQAVTDARFDSDRGARYVTATAVQNLHGLCVGWR